MKAAALNLWVARGEDVTFTGTHQQSDSDTTPVDITGYTIVVTIRNGDGSVNISKNATVNNGPAGQYSWQLAHADTLIPVGIYLIDVWRTDAAAQRALAIGKIEIGKDAKYAT